MSFIDFLNSNNYNPPTPLSDFSIFKDDNELQDTTAPPPSPKKLITKAIKKKKKFCIGEWVKRKKAQIVQKTIKQKIQIKLPAKKQEQPKLKIVQIMPPVKCIRKSAPNKRWVIQFKYTIGNQSKIHSKTVAFGEKNKQYYVDHHDKMRRNVDTRRVWQKHIHNPCKKQFWECHLLQAKLNPQEAYLDMLMNIQ